MSFLLDPPLLIASGAAIERLELEPPGRRAPFGARSGREFMLTSGLARVNAGAAA